MVDGLHISIWNRTVKHPAIAWRGVRKGARERDDKGHLTNVQYKPIWNCTGIPSLQQIYPNKNFKIYMIF
jgi:hypothetical protein